MSNSKYNDAQERITDAKLVFSLESRYGSVSNALSEKNHELEICKYDSDLVEENLLLLKKQQETGKYSLSDYNAMLSIYKEMSDAKNNPPLYKDDNELIGDISAKKQTFSGVYSELESKLSNCKSTGNNLVTELEALKKTPLTKKSSICEEGYRYSKMALNTVPQPGWEGNDAKGYCYTIDPCDKGYYHSLNVCEEYDFPQVGWNGNDVIGYCCEN